MRLHTVYNLLCINIHVLHYRSIDIWWRGAQLRCNIQYMHHFAILKSKQLWIPKHMWPQEFWRVYFKAVYLSLCSALLELYKSYPRFMQWSFINSIYLKSTWNDRTCLTIHLLCIISRSPKRAASTLCRWMWSFLLPWSPGHTVSPTGR